MPKLITEFVGTLLLTLAVSLAITNAGSLAPVAIGCTLIALVYMGGHISGAQYNPAVALCNFLTKNLSFKHFVGYVLAQLAGGVAGAFLATYLTGKHPAPAPADGVANMVALVCEAVFTASLCLVILNVACSPSTKGNQYFGVAIGLTILGAAAVGGPISGGAFNPAVGLGLCYVDAHEAAKPLAHARLYTLGPGAGAIIAAIIFWLQKGGKNG